jgi:hypothetical protein
MSRRLDTPLDDARIKPSIIDTSGTIDADERRRVGRGGRVFGKRPAVRPRHVSSLTYFSTNRLCAK